MSYTEPNEIGSKKGTSVSMVKVSVIRLSIVIAVLASLASATGLLWQGHGSSYPFETVRGEQVMVRGRGLYRYDSVSFAAQGVAQDAVTLIVAVPLLVAATIMAVRGRLAGHLLLSGVLGYFLYTYASYLFGVAYNQLFLLYAALVALSLFAFIGALEPSTWGVCRIGSPPAFRAVLSPADDMIVCVNRAVARTRRGGT